MEHAKSSLPLQSETELSGYLRETAEMLFRLSQDCMDLGVAERLRGIAAEMRRHSTSPVKLDPVHRLGP